MCSIYDGPYGTGDPVISLTPYVPSPPPKEMTEKERMAYFAIMNLVAQTGG